MGDSSETLLQDAEAHARDRLLGSQVLHLDRYTIPWITSHIDCFVSQSRGNESVATLVLYPYAFNGQDDDVWDKVGQAVGNLQALDALCIANHDYRDEDNDEVVPPVRIPNWEILERILRHVRQRVKVAIDDDRLRTMEEVQPFARAIHGHPFITSLQDHGRFPYESLDTLFSTLATLPALESVTLGAPVARQADESTLAYPKSLTDLLRVPTLRFIRFKNFSFTRALSQATANALMEGMAVTKLEFRECSFSSEMSAAILANGLSRNTSLLSISVIQCNNARVLFDALVAALPSNSTL